MPAVSEAIVREFFELHEFLVRQHRKYAGQTRAEEDDDIDFFVLNPHPQPAPGPLPFVLSSGELQFVHRAVVVVKGWHTGNFSPAVVTNAPEIFRFVESKVFREAARAFAPGDALLKILVVPALPGSQDAREKSITLLRSKGVDGVILFRTMLLDLVNGVEINRNYTKSDVLQLVRILKNYDMLIDPQLELFKPRRRRRSPASGRTKPSAPAETNPGRLI